MKSRAFRYLVPSLLAICMICSSVIPVFAERFDDLGSVTKRETKDAINYVSDNGIMTGTHTNQFSPNQSLNRAMFITVLYRLSEDTGSYNGSARFRDVPRSSYYNTAVGWALAKGITDGTSGSTFDPHAYVTNQQVMTFLYRYAGYKKLSQSLETFIGSNVKEKISNANDYAKVSAYALTAMTWACNYGLIVREETGNSLNPKKNASRADCALFINRFVKNVQGIRLNRDAFSFKNTDDSFRTNSNTKRYISTNDWDRFLTAGNFTNKKIADLKNYTYQGYCLGMSVATVLDINGKIDLNGNYCTSTKDMYGIPALSSPFDSRLRLTKDHQTNIKMSEVESKIALYQYSWEIASIRNMIGYVKTNTSLRNLVQDLKHGGVGVFSYMYASDKSHVVVAYGKPICTSIGYQVRLYDNRHPNVQYWLFINTSKAEWTGYVATSSSASNKEVITYCKFQKDLSCYAIIDVDGIFNDAPHSSGDGFNSAGEAYTILDVEASGSFTVVNANNETLTYHNGQISGTMSVLGFDFCPTSSDSPCILRFIMEDSSQYTITFSNPENVVGVRMQQEEQFVTASPDALDNGTVTLICE